MTEMTTAVGHAATSSVARRPGTLWRTAWSGFLDWHRRRSRRASIALSELDHYGLADIGLERPHTVPAALASVRDASHWPRW